MVDAENREPRVVFAVSSSGAIPEEATTQAGEVPADSARSAEDTDDDSLIVPNDLISWGSRASSVISETGREAERPRYAEVHVLLLTFEYNDLDLEMETAKVRKSFSRLGYHVHRYNIKMRQTMARLQRVMSRFLAMGNEESLLIVYYHGHGGLGEDDGLELAR